MSSGIMTMKANASSSCSAFLRTTVSCGGGADADAVAAGREGERGVSAAWGGVFRFCAVLRGGPQAGFPDGAAGECGGGASGDAGAAKAEGSGFGTSGRDFFLSCGPAENVRGFARGFARGCARGARQRQMRMTGDQGHAISAASCFSLFDHKCSSHAVSSCSTSQRHAGWALRGENAGKCRRRWRPGLRRGQWASAYRRA